MVERRFVWIRWHGDLHEEAVDLYSCRRYRVKEFYGEVDRDGETYFQTKDKKWIKHLEYIELPEWDDPGGVREHYRHCAAEEVAHAMLVHNTFGGKLPDDLADLRGHGDPKVHHTWVAQHRAAGSFFAYGPREEKPAWERKTLFYRNEVCREFNKEAPNQFAVLQAFQRENWPARVVVDLTEDHGQRISNML